MLCNTIYIGGLLRTALHAVEFEVQRRYSRPSFCELTKDNGDIKRTLYRPSFEVCKKRFPELKSQRFHSLLHRRHFPAREQHHHDTSRYAVHDRVHVYSYTAIRKACFHAPFLEKPKSPQKRTTIDSRRSAANLQEVTLISRLRGQSRGE